MKYALLNLYQLIKTKYLLISFMYLGLYTILFITTNGFRTNPSSFNIMLGCPPYDYSLQVLWTIFQVSCHVYIVYNFFSCEQDASLEYLILRESYQKLFLKKFIIMICATVITRFIIFLVTYFFYYKLISFPLTSFIYNILIYIVITILTSMVVYHFSK